MTSAELLFQERPMGIHPIMEVLHLALEPEDVRALAPYRKVAISLAPVGFILACRAVELGGIGVDEPLHDVPVERGVDQRAEALAEGLADGGVLQHPGEQAVLF